jgi:hypothetical protein
VLSRLEHFDDEVRAMQKWSASSAAQELLVEGLWLSPFLADVITRIGPRGFFSRELTDAKDATHPSPGRGTLDRSLGSVTNEVQGLRHTAREFLAGLDRLNAVLRTLDRQLLQESAVKRYFEVKRGDKGRPRSWTAPVDRALRKLDVPREIRRRVLEIVARRFHLQGPPRRTAR